MGVFNNVPTIGDLSTEQKLEALVRGQVMLHELVAEHHDAITGLQAVVGALCEHLGFMDETPESPLVEGVDEDGYVVETYTSHVDSIDEALP